MLHKITYRLGNWIYDSEMDTSFQIEEYNIKNILDEKGELIKPFQPIQITEARLVEYGFKKKKGFVASS